MKKIWGFAWHEYRGFNNPGSSARPQLDHGPHPSIEPVREQLVADYRVSNFKKYEDRESLTHTNRRTYVDLVCKPHVHCLVMYDERSRDTSCTLYVLRHIGTIQSVVFKPNNK